MIKARGTLLHRVGMTRKQAAHFLCKGAHMNALAIRLDQLTRDFASVRALDNLSLTVPTGVVYGFLEPNGAGKTTTINLLLGLLEPTEGCAEVLGFDTRTHADEIRSRTGALLEHTGLYEQMSAKDNLEFYGRVNRLSAADRSARIKELLTNIGLWERRTEKVGKWSKGMKQKLALARAMLHRPPLLLLDEPTAGLDVMAANEVRADLATLAAQEGITIPDDAQHGRSRKTVRGSGRDSIGQAASRRPTRSAPRANRQPARGDRRARLRRSNAEGASSPAAGGLRGHAEPSPHHQPAR